MTCLAVQFAPFIQRVVLSHHDSCRPFPLCSALLCNLCRHRPGVGSACWRLRCLYGARTILTTVLAPAEGTPPRDFSRASAGAKLRRLRPSSRLLSSCLSPCRWHKVCNALCFLAWTAAEGSMAPAEKTRVLWIICRSHTVQLLDSVQYICKVGALVRTNVLHKTCREKLC